MDYGHIIYPIRSTFSASITDSRIDLIHLQERDTISSVKSYHEIVQKRNSAHSPMLLKLSVVVL
jgi:hypothetical protein